MAIHYKELGHVGLRCRDHQGMIDFYTRKLGFEEKFHLDNDDGSLWLTYLATGGGQYIEIFTDGYEGDNNYGKRSHAHFCLEVSNFPLALDALEAKGVKIFDGPEGEPLEKPYGKRKPGMCGSLCAFIEDPEGNWIEIMQYTPRSMQIICN